MSNLRRFYLMDGATQNVAKINDDGSLNIYSPNITNKKSVQTDVYFDTSYITLLDVQGKGVVDFIYMNFNSLHEIYLKITIDNETYYEGEIYDLKYRFSSSLKPTDIPFIIEDNQYIERFDNGLHFNSNIKIDVKLTKSRRRYLKLGVFRYVVEQ